jgi:hypothetical protein
MEDLAVIGARRRNSSDVHDSGSGKGLPVEYQTRPRSVGAPVGGCPRMHGSVVEQGPSAVISRRLLGNDEWSSTRIGGGPLKARATKPVAPSGLEAGTE